MQKNHPNIKYENRYVLFLDILGFKKLVQDTENDDTNTKIKKLHNTLSIIQTFAKSKPMQRTATQFSDSIVISFIQENDSELIYLLDEIIDLLMELVSNGIICRGAIAYGKFFHDNKILFGPALVDAYETESKAAMYPRIILDKSIIKTFKEHKIINTKNKIYKKNIDLFLKEDLDDRLYIDYFEYPFDKVTHVNDYIIYMKKLREIISIEGSKARSSDIKIKYGWMKIKFNNALKKYQAVFDKYSNDKDMFEEFSNIKLL